jgi:hypothetical protein
VGGFEARVDGGDFGWGGGAAGEGAVADVVAWWEEGREGVSVEDDGRSARVERGGGKGAARDLVSR